MSFTLANFLENIPRTNHYHSKRMSYCRKFGSPSVLPSDWRNALERLLSALSIPQGCADCGHKFYILKWKERVRQRRYPQNML
jgi:hypothetical protein